MKNNKKNSKFNNNLKKKIYLKNFKIHNNKIKLFLNKANKLTHFKIKIIQQIVTI